MKKQTTYNPLENSSELTPADINNLWMNMKQVLDTEMPEEKERRRFFAWLFRSKVLFSVCCIAALTAMFVHIRMADMRHAGPLAMPLPDLKETTSDDKTNNEREFDNFTQKTVPLHQNRQDHTIDIIIEDPIQRQMEVLREDAHEQQLKTAETGNQLPQAPAAIEYSTGKKSTNHLISNRQVNKNSEQPKLNLLSPVSDYEINNDVAVENIKRNLNSIPTIGFLSSEYHSVQASEQYLVKETPVLRSRTKMKGFTAGVSMNMNIPVSSQEMSTSSMTGEKSSALDYLPSIYAGYHFNNKLSVEGEFQFVSPQYTPQHKLSSKWSDVTANHYNEEIITLNKLYYLNIPVSVHYTPVKGLYVGTGMQYSQLKKSVFVQEDCSWDKDASGWKMTSSTKTTKVKSVNENKGKDNNNAGGNPGGGNPGGGNPGSANPPMTKIDTIAQGFKKTDWRWMVEVSYQYHRFNAGIRFNMGLDNYINTKAGNINYDIPDRNKSFMLRLRYDILDTRKKSK